MREAAGADDGGAMTTTLLHIVATPRQHQSSTLAVADAYLDELARHVPDLRVETVDLFRTDLPAVAGANIDTKYNLMHGVPLDDEARRSWGQIEELIAAFKGADQYLVSSPMWNLGIPYVLKYYIDCLIQPGYLFRYDETGVPVPMINGRSMVCVTSRGGSYEPGSPMGALDFQEPYLRAIFGFVGISDIEFVNAQPVDVPGLRETALAAAVAQAREVAARPVLAIPA
jgi:FMN-dependent NADH-azoreductase